MKWSPAYLWEGGKRPIPAFLQEGDPYPVHSTDSADPLHLFLPPVRQWFQTSLGEPTPAQRLGWPSSSAGKHTLILAPTGSGKTLAAFLACLDQLWRETSAPLTPNPSPPQGGRGAGVRGVRVLYISPLKALNNDIYRNLQV